MNTERNTATRPTLRIRWRVIGSLAVLLVGLTLLVLGGLEPMKVNGLDMAGQLLTAIGAIATIWQRMPQG